MKKQDELLELLRTTASRIIERPLPDIELDTQVSSLGIDSVSLAEIVTVVEDSLGIEIPAMEWLQVRTMNDFVQAIERAQLGQNR